jgi:hypothetical protein
MVERNGRQSCILFLSCIGIGQQYFLPLSQDFDRRYAITPFIFHNRAWLPDIFHKLDQVIGDCAVLLYHEPDWMPYLGEFREPYDTFLERIPSHVTKISIPQPHFFALWPFHSGDPRNDDPNRPRNRYGKLPVYHYGDSYIIKMLREGLPPETVIDRYLSADIAAEADLDRLLRRSLAMMRTKDQTGPVKVADYISENFRTMSLFQTVNHANNRLLLYMTNQALKFLECREVPESVLDRTTELVEEPMPVHPNIARHYGISYIDENTRYPVDEIRMLTFAEFIRDYVYYQDGLIN